MKRKAHIILLVLLLLCVLSTTAFAIDESEVESAIAASSKEEVAGNVFIWFLCAIGFLKVSQKIDSFMASLGINVGRTGGSMLTELMVAGRGIAAVAGAVGGTVFNHHSSSNSTHTNAQAAGAAFTGGGNGPCRRYETCCWKRGSRKRYRQCKRTQQSCGWRYVRIKPAKWRQICNERCWSCGKRQHILSRVHHR